MRGPASGAAALLLLAAGCGGGGSGELPLDPIDVPPEMLFVTSRIESRFRDTEIRKADARGLEQKLVLDRDGIERDVRVFSDGNRLTFARQTRNGVAESSEIFVGTLDGTEPEVRLTVDDELDDGPCWSPDGTRICFSSERLGTGRRLFLIDPDGANAEVLFDEGVAQQDPDWSASSGDIVYARQTAGRHQLWTFDPVRRVPLQLTDGGTGVATARSPGDVEPCWSPDGSRVLFRRILSDDDSQLCTVEVASGVVTELSAASVAGEHSEPRWSPLQDRIFFAATRPAVGIDSLRLWTASTNGTDAWLIFCDKRYDFLGFDPLPTMSAAETRTLEQENANLENAEIVNGFGTQTRGLPEFIFAPDNLVYGIGTEPSGGREIAGIDIRVPLGNDAPETALVVEVQVTAAMTRSDGDDLLRVAIRNVVAGRNDTVAELVPDGSQQTVRFPVTGLAYLDRNGRFGVTVVGDKNAAAPGELLIDHVGLRVSRIAPAPTSGGGDRAR